MILNIPLNHPAREMWDTFWLKKEETDRNLKDKKTKLKIMYDRKEPFDHEILDEIDNVHPKQLKRVCSTNFKYICVSGIGNRLTYYVSVTRKEFTWYSTSSDIIKAVLAIKKKFAEHGIKCGSIRRY